MTTSPTIAKTFGRKLGHNLLACLALAAVLAFGVATQEKTGFEPTAPEGSARALVEQHGCSDHVKDPTHSVVTIDGVTRYVGQTMTDRAIEQVAFGMDHGMTVHGFCA